MDTLNAENIKTEFTCVEILPDTAEGMEASSSLQTSGVSSFVLDRNEREIVFQFIELVRNCPEIWDVTSLAYRDKIVRRRSFRKIAEELGWTYSDVVKKYNNLRTYYTKEVIKMKRGNYQSKWPYFEQLNSFLRESIHTRNTANRHGAKRSKLLLTRSYDAVQLSAGLRRKRTALGIGSDGRLRTTFHSRVAASVGSTASVATPSMSLATLAPSTSTHTDVPLPNMQQAAPSMPPQPQLQVRQAPPSSSTSVTSTRQQRDVVQSQQLQQHLRDSEPPPLRPHQLQHAQLSRQHQQQQHQQNQRPTASTPTATVNRIVSKGQKSLSGVPTPSSSSTSSFSSSSWDDKESTDVLFGKLVANQLTKIKDGRSKELLKINLMQQIVEAMFNDQGS